MNIATGIAVYLVIWWTVLFAILPLGVRRMEQPPPGHDRGAPERPQLLRKVVLTSLVAGAIWIAFYVVYSSDLLSFRRFAENL